jgi:hypothetical protein
MRRFVLLIGCALAILLGGAVSAAQSVVVPVVFPVRGSYAVAVGDNQLYMVDTFTGELSLLSQGETSLDSPVWDATGQYLAYRNGRTASTILNMASTSQQVIQSFPERNASYPQGWSSDGSSILYSSSKFTLEGLVAFNLDMFDVGSGTLVNLLHYEVDQPLTTVPLPPLPPEVSGLAFREIIQASWNPVYEEWIAVQLTGFTPDFDMSELVSGAKFPITLVYNRNTGQMLSLDQLIPEQISTAPLTWSPDGTRLIVQTGTLSIPTKCQYVVTLHDAGGDWSLDTLDRVEEDVVIVDWLGVEDLLWPIPGSPTIGSSMSPKSAMGSGSPPSSSGFRTSMRCTCLSRATGTWPPRPKIRRRSPACSTPPCPRGWRSAGGGRLPSQMARRAACATRRGWTARKWP